MANFEKAKNEEKVVLKNVIIKQVSSPSTIQSVAVDKGINPQEVFVRIIFEYEGENYKASNKLRFLTKAGYRELLEAKQNAKPMTLVVGLESEFFYIEHDVSVDDLFKETVSGPTVSLETKALATLAEAIV